jgi:hypothetical protein
MAKHDNDIAAMAFEDLFVPLRNDGVPTWEICRKEGKRGEWNVIAKGTADSFEAAKAAALFEAEAASRMP